MFDYFWIAILLGAAAFLALIHGARSALTATGLIVILAAVYRALFYLWPENGKYYFLITLLLCVAIFYYIRWRIGK